MVKPGYMQTEIGMIPENWDVKPLKAVAPLQRGFDLPYSSIKDGKYPVVFSNGVGALHSSYMVKGPGVITGRSGTIGKIHYVENDYWPHNTALWVTDFHNNDPLYVYYLFKTIPWNLYNSGSGVPTLNRNDIHDYLVAIPSRSEQAKISTILADIDKLIVSFEKQLSKKKAIKQGAMQELLTGKKRLPGFSGEWKTIPLTNALTVGHGMSQHNVESPTGKYPILATGGEIGKATTYLWDKPSVLIGRKGTINKPQYMDRPFWSIDTLFYTKIKEGYYPKFLYYVFCQIDWLNYNEASGVPSLSAKTIESIEVQVPEYAEQIAIADLLSEMDSEIELLEQKLAKYRQVKQGMMQQLLTGKIRLV